MDSMIPRKVFSESKIFLYISLLSLIYIYSWIIAVEVSEPIVVQPIPYYNIVLIFLINVTVFHLLFLLSFVGMSIPMSIHFFYTMSLSGLESGLQPDLYFLSSYSHGVLELVIYFVMCSFTIEIFKTYWIAFKQKDSKLIEKNTKQFLRNYYYWLVILIFIAAIVEVLISNRLINYFLIYRN